MTPIERATRMRKIGRRCFGLFWIPFVGIFVGMIGLPTGSYTWSALPALMRYSMIACVVLMVLGFGFFFGTLFVTGAANQRVVSRGKRAKADILRIQDTGTTVNENPLVQLSLNVKPQNGAPFEADVEQVVSRLDVPRLQPGETIDVKYLPGNREVTVVEF